MDAFWCITLGMIILRIAKRKIQEENNINKEEKITDEELISVVLPTIKDK